MTVMVQRDARICVKGLQETFTKEDFEDLKSNTGDRHQQGHWQMRIHNGNSRGSKHSFTVTDIGLY